MDKIIIDWKSQEPANIQGPVNIIDSLKALSKAIKAQQERENDPSWKQEWVYFVSPQVVSWLERGLISERDISLYAFESRLVWVHDEEI